MKQPQTKATLISKVANQGDEQAWSEFISQYKGYLRVILSRTYLAEKDLEDCLQNILIRIWELMPEFDYKPEKGRFRSWIAQIAINKARSYVRQENKELNTKQSLCDLNEIELNDSLDDEWKIFISKKAWENVKEELNDIMKNSFQLHLDGFKNPEISEKLGISEAVFRVYKQRVSYKLKYEIKRLHRELN